MRAIYLSIITILLVSCTGYQKVIKKGTDQEKLEAARKYYKKDDCVRAQTLLEDLMGLYFGKPEREEIFYMYAYSHYCLNQFLLAGYYFKSFNNTYPLSDKREECAYMATLCEYHRTLSFELDQSYTQSAINSLQSFINQYPNSDKVEDCNKKIDELRARILLKVYESAKLWYRMGDYKAAMVACNNAIEDYPDMIHRDELMFMVADASFQYASFSVKTQQLERFEEAKKAVDNFLKEYKSDNQYYDAVIALQKKTNEMIEELKAEENGSAQTNE